MPLVRISLRKGTSSEFRAKLGNGVHRALVETLNVPPDDRFQVITEHDETGLVYDPAYFDITRTDRLIFIQVTLTTGRSLEAKRAFYAKVVEFLAAEPGVRPEDVFINLVEVSTENWSFGKGEAQYVK